MIRVQSWFSLTGAIGLLVWWFFMPVYLPVADSATNFQALILDQDWIWVNMIGLLASGVCLGVGYLLFGISALQTRAFSKAPIWCMLLGALVFGNGIVFPLRTLGLLLFVTGTIWLALIIIKSTKAIRS